MPVGVEKIRLIESLRHERFDLVVDLRDSVWSRFAGRKRWGMQFGTLIVAIFESTNHHRSGPYGEEHIGVHSGMELGCNPCPLGKRPGGCGKGSCAVIEAVTVEQVFNAAEKLKHMKYR